MKVPVPLRILALTVATTARISWSERPIGGLWMAGMPGLKPGTMKAPGS